MFVVNEDNSIYATRGDIVFFSVTANDNGEAHQFQAGDVLRVKIYEKKAADKVVLQKDFPVLEATESVEIFLTEEDTKLGEVISKPKDYWYEVELNPYDNPQTIIGYNEDGATVFKLFPEGDDIPEFVPDPEDFRVMDDELDMTSTRPVENQAVARAVVSLRGLAEDTAEGLAIEKARFDNLISEDNTTVSKILVYMAYTTENTKAKVDAHIESDGARASIKVNHREANFLVGGSNMDVFIIPKECRPINTGLIHTEDGMEYSINYDTTRESYVLNLKAQDDVTYAPGEARTVTFSYALGDYELKDVRVGADGKIYPTAGEAVRAQFETMKAASAAVTPQMFGAVGDGKADDTEALQNMVDYAAQESKRIFLQSGTYLISKTIVCDFSESRMLEFIGCGQKSRFVVADDFDGDKAFAFYVKPTNHRNLDVGNFEVVLTKSVSGIYFNEIGMSAVIHDIFIDGSWEDGDSETAYGIYTHTATVAEYRNNKIIGVASGMVFDVSHSVHIDKCDISFCKYGVVLSGGSNISIMRCRIDENVVGVIQNSSDTIATEHRPYSFNGTFVGLTISDNRFESNSYASILLIAYANGYLANNGVNIERNYFTGLTSENSGIAMARCVKLRIAENSFKGTETAVPIRSLGSLIKVELKSNTCVINPDGTKCNATLDNSTRSALDFDYDIETNQSNEKTVETYYLRKKIVSAITNGELDANDYNVIQLATSSASTVSKIADNNLLYVCKELSVLCDGKTTFKHSGVLKLKDGADITPDALQIIKFLGVYSDGVRWIQI